MVIAVVHEPQDRAAGDLVAAALARSFSARQVVRLCPAELSDAPDGVVVIHPNRSFASQWDDLLRSGRKVILLGRLDEALAPRLGLQPSAEPLEPGDADAEPFGASRLSIRYDDAHPLAAVVPLRQRALCRFDFAQEWNNLGFGRIPLDGSVWSLAGKWRSTGMTVLAGLDGLVYSGLHETADAACLFINRAVGPIDSLEWRLVEAFLGDYRPDLSCFPYLDELPAGYDAAATARLDCDEAIVAARPVFELYASIGMPLTLAIKTDQPIGGEERRLLADVLDAGGSIASHSVHHFPNWGGAFATARAEAMQSRQFLEGVVGRPVRYVVSPFHQNPDYAVQALAEHYDGVVAGILANDPEMLLGRSGQVPGARAGFVTHSQQCMLHGDCPANYSESLHHHCQARAVFGYLDHPFSARYQYGWASEAARLAAHRTLLETLAQSGRVWRPNLEEHFDFIRRRTRTQLSRDAHWALIVETDSCAGPRLAVRWKGETFAEESAWTKTTGP